MLRAILPFVYWTVVMVGIALILGGCDLPLFIL